MQKKIREEPSDQGIHSSRVVQQEGRLELLCYSAEGIETLRRFKEALPVLGAVGFIGDIVIILPPEQALYMRSVPKITRRLADKLAQVRPSFKRFNSRALLSGGRGVGELPVKQQGKLTVAPKGMAVVGVPVDSEQ